MRLVVWMYRGNAEVGVSREARRERETMCENVTSDLQGEGKARGWKFQQEMGNLRAVGWKGRRRPSRMGVG